MQQCADIYLLLNYSTCFGRPSLPSSGVYKTVVADSGTDHTIWVASFTKRDQISLHTVASRYISSTLNYEYNARNHEYKKNILLSLNH